MSSHLLGRTPVGMRVWDGSRIVDFLRSRPEVDGRRIGSAGLSGGGASTLYFSAMEDRIALSMIGGFFSTFRDSLFSKYHCICQCVPHMMQWGEMSDIAALIAPRPLLLVNGTGDDGFPISGARAGHAVLRKVYGLLNAEDSLEKDFFQGGHQWSNRKSLKFLRKHFGLS